MLVDVVYVLGHGGCLPVLDHSRAMTLRTGSLSVGHVRSQSAAGISGVTRHVVPRLVPPYSVGVLVVACVLVPFLLNCNVLGSVCGRGCGRVRATHSGVVCAVGP